MKLEGLVKYGAVCLLAFVLMAAAAENGNFMDTLSENSMMGHCLFSGRWDHGQGFSRTSAPAAMLQFNAQANVLEFDVEGVSRFRVDEDGNEIGQFVSDRRKVHKVKTSGDGRPHRFRLVKISETNPGAVKVYNVSLDGHGKFNDTPGRNGRRIEFIGDSFTVGYGCEGKLSDDDSQVFAKTNAAKSYAFLLADRLEADFQVNAFSGRGLVRNYDNIVPQWKIPRLYEYTVPGEAPSDVATGHALPYDFNSFHPQVIVLFVGINDFQGNPPYGDKGEFITAYKALLKKLREAHNGVKFLLVSTKIWPNDDLTPTVKAVFKSEWDEGYRDLEFVEVHTENLGLHGHPTEQSQEELARTLGPIVGKLGGWPLRY